MSGCRQAMSPNWRCNVDFFINLNSLSDSDAGSGDRTRFSLAVVKLFDRLSKTLTHTIFCLVNHPVRRKRENYTALAFLAWWVSSSDDVYYPLQDDRIITSVPVISLVCCRSIMDQIVAVTFQHIPRTNNVALPLATHRRARTQGPTRKHPEVTMIEIDGLSQGNQNYKS